MLGLRSSARTMLATTTLAASMAVGGTVAAKPVDIITYHYDNYRTGWNSHERKLTPASVASANFGLVASTVLDDQVDAQPLILGNQSVNGNSAREIVYIATNGDTVYAIDAKTGDILLQRNLGTPVPRSTLPGQCTNGGPNLGINSTPTMDPVSHTIYLIAATYENQKPIWRVHALDPSTFADVVTPVEVTASGKLTDGTKYKFDPHEARNRAALLLANGNLYAGFASYCDYDANLSRGWVLGWNAGTLNPLKANEFTNKLATSTNNFFLSTIWMSGFGLAGSTAGDVYFITGNSDYAGNAYDPVTNITESVVQMSADLSTVKHLYTPMGANGWQELDREDGDFGAGGFMLLPPQRHQPTNLAVATGKAGIMYVFNADDISNGQPNGGKEYSSVSPGPCWCGPSYYVGSDGVSRIVSSSSNTVGVWKLKAKGTPTLSLDKNVGSVEGVYFPGFFTSVSSNGTKPGTTVIWAMGRATDFGQEALKLHAYDAEKGGEIFSAQAGYWTNSISDDNTVPVAANGKVYVATVKSLTIWGLKKNGAASASLPPAPRILPRAPLAPGVHEIRGTVRNISGYTLLVQKRDGTMITVDSTMAAANHKAAPPSVGHALFARGKVEGDVMKAEIVGHVPDALQAWQPDR